MDKIQSILIGSILFLSGCVDSDSRAKSTIEEHRIELKSKRIYCDGSDLAYYVTVDFSGNVIDTPIYNKKKQHMTCEEHKTLFSQERKIVVK